jgi:hypothetical protein
MAAISFCNSVVHQLLHFAFIMSLADWPIRAAKLQSNTIMVYRRKSYFTQPFRTTKYGWFVRSAEKPGYSHAFAGVSFSSK